MARVFVLCAALFALTCAADALRLPSYIKACRKDDPKLNECAVKHGREAIPGFINGDRKYRTPNLNPLTVYDFRLDEGTNAVGLKIYLKEAKIYGLDRAEFTDADIDLKKQKMELKFHLEKVSIVGQYNVSGRVLVLPITGNGDANITLGNLDLTYTVNYDLQKRKGGKEYIVIKDSHLGFKAGKAHFKLTNLFNGDRLLGDNMNKFLNDNWREVLKELGPAVAEAIKQVIVQILEKIVELVPYENVFL